MIKYVAVAFSGIILLLGSSPIFAQKTTDSLTTYDRVLGMLVGSAMGDAMGAPTEMWSREGIQANYGFVSGLDSMVREPSAEGTWHMNLPAGGTTDDTRWKVLTLSFMLDYLQKGKASDPGKAFARYLLDTYEDHVQALNRLKGNDLQPYEDAVMEAEWLKEWAIVAEPYVKGDWPAYDLALNKFYGGEMVCGGLLFAPAVGVCFPGDPEAAYRMAYALDIYDIGMGRDMAGLAAAMAAEAAAGKSPREILAVFRSVDPYDYFNSRLVGRTAHHLLQDAQRICYQSAANGDALPPAVQVAWRNGTDSLPYAQAKTTALWHAYEMLDIHQERMPFHPSEITLIGLTALIFSDFDLPNSLRFAINYGRDNDTVGAWIGGVAGAKEGYSGLPQPWVAKIWAATSDQGASWKELASRLAKAIDSK